MDQRALDAEPIFKFFLACYVEPFEELTKGLSLQLDVMPMNGRIVLRQPSINTGEGRAGA